MFSCIVLMDWRSTPKAFMLGTMFYNSQSHIVIHFHLHTYRQSMTQKERRCYNKKKIVESLKYLVVTLLASLKSLCTQTQTAIQNTVRSITKACMIWTQSTDTSLTSSIVYAQWEDGVFVGKCTGNYLDLKGTINLFSFYKEAYGFDLKCPKHCGTSPKYFSFFISPK